MFQRPNLGRRLEVLAGEVESTIKELGPQFYGNLLLYVGLADLGLESLPKYPELLPSGVHSLLQLGLENRETLGPQQLMRRGLQVINSMDNVSSGHKSIMDLLFRKNWHVRITSVFKIQLAHQYQFVPRT